MSVVECGQWRLQARKGALNRGLHVSRWAVLTGLHTHSREHFRGVTGLALEVEMVSVKKSEEFELESSCPSAWNGLYNYEKSPMTTASVSCLNDFEQFL